MNDMRKLMQLITESMDRTEIEHIAYAAAELYHKAPRGTTMPMTAKQLSEKAGIDIDTAILLIAAIDASEDIRET